MAFPGSFSGQGYQQLNNIFGPGMAGTRMAGQNLRGDYQKAAQGGGWASQLGGGLGGLAGGALGGPLGALGGQLAGSFLQNQALPWLGNKLFGGNDMTQQHQQGQQELLQGLRTPYRANFEPIAAAARGRFENQTIPGIQNRFAGAGLENSSGMLGALSSAGGDLERELAMLQEQSQGNEFDRNQGRLGQLGGYLGGQQQLAQNENQFNKKYTNDLLGRALQYGDLGARYREINNPINSLQAQQNIGLGQQSDKLRHEGTAGWPQQGLQTLIKIMQSRGGVA